MTPPSGDFVDTASATNLRLRIFLQRLYDACWLAEFGWVKTAKDGKPLARAIIDATVGDPSRLVFEGQPEIVPPLVQAARMADFFDGGPVDTRALPPLSDAQQVRLDALREAARQRWEGSHPGRPSKPRVARPTPTPRRLDRDDDDLVPVRAALRADAAGVAEALLGPPNKTRSNKKELRWGTLGGRSVGIAGPKRGRWSDYEAGKSGDMLSLIRHVKGCDFPAAVAWARNHTGIAEPPHRERTRTGAPASHQPAPDPLASLRGRAGADRRARPRRQPRCEQPLQVLIMTDVPLPIPVDEEVYADDLRPSPADLMLGETGVALENPADAAAVHPGLWLTSSAAKGVIRRNRRPWPMPWRRPVVCCRWWRRGCTPTMATCSAPSGRRSGCWPSSPPVSCRPAGDWRVTRSSGSSSRPAH
jgi:hypothetical protein